MDVQIIYKNLKINSKIKPSNKSSFVILIFTILKFRKIGRSEFRRSVVEGLKIINAGGGGGGSSSTTVNLFKLKIFSRTALVSTLSCVHSVVLTGFFFSNVYIQKKRDTDWRLYSWRIEVIVVQLTVSSLQFSPEIRDTILHSQSVERDSPKFIALGAVRRNDPFTTCDTAAVQRWNNHVLKGERCICRFIFTILVCATTFLSPSRLLSVSFNSRTSAIWVLSKHFLLSIINIVNEISFVVQIYSLPFVNNFSGLIAHRLRIRPSVRICDSSIRWSWRLLNRDEIKMEKISVVNIYLFCKH